MRYGVILAVVLLASLTLGVLSQISTEVTANPIPSVPAFLKAEYINITIERLSDDKAVVLVDGVYPMEFTEEGGFVYFPIPKEVLSSNKIEVSLGEENIGYNITWKGVFVAYNKSFQYESSIGVLPMICFKVNESVKGKTIPVRITYSYEITASKVSGYKLFRTIYAMGTGRYYITYGKTCVAYVNIWVKGFKGYKITLSLDPGSPRTLKRITVISERIWSDMKKYYLERTGIFGGIREDLIITIKKEADVIEAKPRNISLSSLKIGNGYIRGELILTFKDTGYITEFLMAEYTDGAVNVYLLVYDMLNVTVLPVIQKAPVEFTVPYNANESVSNILVNVYVNGELYKSIPAQQGSNDKDNNNDITKNMNYGPVIGIITAIVLVSALTILGLKRRI